MTGLGKESLPKPPNQPPPSTAKMDDQPMPSQVWRDVPMDIYKYFNVDFFDASDRHIDEMKTVTEFALNNSNKRPGDMIQKLQELEVRLGAPRIGETMLNKMYNWIEIRNVMSDMRKKGKALENGYR